MAPAKNIRCVNAIKQNKKRQRECANVHENTVNNLMVKHDEIEK